MHKQSDKIFLLSLIVISLCTGVIGAQIVVERSKDKVVISGKPYYVHIVKKGETAYSISKTYGISVEELSKENPPAVYGIKEGQSLRIPVVENPEKTKTAEPVTRKVNRDVAKYIYHKLNPGETVYFLSKKYGVSENEIVQSNPGVEINKMSVGSEIAIPRREFMSDVQKFETQDKNYNYHKVVKGETLYSIAEEYGITVRELRRENKGLLFPKVDDFVRIPVPKPAETAITEQTRTDTINVATEEPVIQPERPAGYTHVGDLRGRYNVALLLPLYFAENSNRTEIDSSQVIKGKPVYKIITRPDQWIYPGTAPFLELYEGILLASDTLRSHGLKINLHVYDIKSDTVGVTKLIESGELKDMDLIIGPVYSRNLSIVAAYAGLYEIPVISPVPLRSNASLNNNPFLFMANPSLEVAQEIIAKRASEYYNSNFVFIHSDTSRVDPDVDAFKSKIFREISSKIPYEEIKFKEFVFYNRSAFDNDSINRLEHALSDQTDNLVLIASEEPPVLSESIMDIHTLAKKFSVRLIGYPAMRGLDNLDPKYYFELGIELYSPYWIDYNKSDVKDFNASFRRKFLTEPSETSFAWQGYDIAYYFLSGLAIHGKEFISHPEIHNPDLLETEFDFRRKGEGNGFENQKLFLIKYTSEMDVKVLEDSDTGSSQTIK